MEPLLSVRDVQFGRELAEAHFIDTCQITVDGTGETGPINEETGQYDDPPRRVVYGPGATTEAGVPITDPEVLSGKCRIQVRSDINANAVEAVIGEHEFTYRTATLQLPIAGTADVRPDSIAVLLSCPLDPSLEGAEFNVQAETKGKTHATHRRYRIREVVK